IEQGLAQKKALALSTPDNWPAIESPAISNDGRAVLYAINIPSKGSRLIVQATDRSWKRELPGVSRGLFTSDSRRMIFKTLGDSLGIFELGADNIRYISGVNSFSIPLEGNGVWLAVQKKDAENTL